MVCGVVIFSRLRYPAPAVDGGLKTEPDGITGRWHRALQAPQVVLFMLAHGESVHLYAVVSVVVFHLIFLFRRRAYTSRCRCFVATSGSPR